MNDLQVLDSLLPASVCPNHATESSMQAYKDRQIKHLLYGAVIAILILISPVGPNRKSLIVSNKEGIMAIVLMEEVLMGLDEVKGALDQAVTTLEDIIEDMSPDLGEDLQELLETSFFDPLQSRRDALDILLNRLSESVN